MNGSRFLHLVAYDVSDPRRLRAALELVRAFSTGGQKSVHECYMTESECAALVANADEILDPSRDRMMVLRLDPRARTFSLGTGRPPEQPACFYFA
jgi:CRISPR-associated protein Cas2